MNMITLKTVICFIIIIIIIIIIVETLIHYYPKLWALKSKSKYIYNVTKDLYFKQMLFCITVSYRILMNHSK